FIRGLTPPARLSVLGTLYSVLALLAGCQRAAGPATAPLQLDATSVRVGFPGGTAGQESGRSRNGAWAPVYATLKARDAVKPAPPRGRGGRSPPPPPARPPSAAMGRPAPPPPRRRSRPGPRARTGWPPATFGPAPPVARSASASRPPTAGRCSTPRALPATPA